MRLTCAEPRLRQLISQPLALLGNDQRHLDAWHAWHYIGHHRLLLTSPASLMIQPHNVLLDPEGVLGDGVSVFDAGHD